ncbi:SDR family NAD(P)-dependent oxidoreductase [Amycolatopsis sp. NPDC101161]|uniref:SDR family NAD(P)-dependent oxidoreductase n=1 Tax=Amycolatopsis sp. NPDC101161 TaxID=3363940 RepID=UPI00381640C0
MAAVTGASSGIGLELAKQLARHDFDVVPAAEDAEPVAAADQVRACGGPGSRSSSGSSTADRWRRRP